MSKLVITGSIIVAVAVALVIKRNRRKRAPLYRDDTAGADLALAIDLGDPGDELVEEVIVIATGSGMADVDPEPLAQTAGEGIALDPIAAAHTEIEELRERLPGPGTGKGG